MNYKTRIVTKKLRHMVERFSVVVVSGARRVGKSTLLEHVFGDWPAVVFDPAMDVGNARQDPDLFLDNHPAPLILDEIQYAPELVAAIKRRVDRTRRPGQYVLTGSQQWSVLKSASESLAGRAVFLDLEGFCLAEIAQATTDRHWLKRYLDAPDDFVADPPQRLPSDKTVYEQLWRGFMPESDSLEQDWLGEFHRAYMRTYIERDVRLISDVSDWQQFGRFVQLVAALTAQEINYARLGRELGVTLQTAQRWLAMLKATFQWFEAAAYHGNTIKRISSRPKGYFADTGLACSLQMISKPQTLGGHPMVGALFETAVIGEIRKLAATLSTPPSLYHWRSHGAGEIDLLLERDATFYPIEVKLGSNPSKGDLRGIKAFRNTYRRLNIAPGLVICPTERCMLLGDNEYALPWDVR